MSELGKILQLKRALIKTRSQNLLLQSEILRLTTEPEVYALVISVIEPDSKAREANYASLPIGAMAQVIKSTRTPDRIGKIGFILSGADQNGDALIGFEDDLEAFFNVGLPGQSDRREIEVVPINERRVVVSFAGRLLELKYPDQLVVRPGDTVKLSDSTSQILGVVKQPTKNGITGVVQKIIAPERCLVTIHNTKHVVSTGVFGGLIEEGQEVVIDQSLNIILDNLGKIEEFFKLIEPANITLDDIVGLEEAKKQLIEAIVWPIKYKELYEHYNKQPISGILLFGPHGNGKTMLGKAAAHMMAELEGDVSKAPAGIIYIKGPEILVKWVGDPEERLRYAFRLAKEYKRKTGRRAIIYLDEAEAVLRKRGTGISTDVQDTLVATWNSETDGLQPMDAILMLATNRQDILDPAAIREGRIDRKIEVKRPDQNEAVLVFQHYLKKVPTKDSADDLAEYAAKQLTSDKYKLYQIQVMDDKPKVLTLINISSRAMIFNIVDQATSLALERDIKSGKNSAVTKDDLDEAVRLAYVQNYSLNHLDAIQELTTDYKEKITGIQKMKQAQR